MTKFNREADDALYARAVALVIERQQASVSMIQRALRIGFSQAAAYLDEMEALGIVSAANTVGRRTVLIGSGNQGPSAERAAPTRRSEAPK